MDKEQIKNRINKLREQLHHYNYQYYVLAQPEISDYEYDILINELITLEKNNPEFSDSNSPTQRVGSDINKEFTQVVHKYPMLSLGNTYSIEEVIDFENRVKKLLPNEQVEFVCELKFDGVAIGLNPLGITVLISDQHRVNGDFHFLRVAVLIELLLQALDM